MPRTVALASELYSEKFSGLYSEIVIADVIGEVLTIFTRCITTATH